MNTALHHGAFSWSELMTSDPAAASNFYASVLGWRIHSEEMSTGPYHVGMVGELPVGGMAEHPEEGVPTAWTFYVTVSNVDETVEKALALGAQKIYEPMDVPTVGRMCGLMDPQGALVNVITYEPMENPDPDNPAFVENFKTPGCFSWYSLQTPDVEAAKRFYAEVFGWNYRVDHMGMGPYTIFHVGDVGMGGIIPPMQEGTPPHWAAYVTVEDADAAAEAARSKGGAVIMEPFDIPTVGRNAVIQDPTGGILNVIKYVPMEQPA